MRPLSRPVPRRVEHFRLATPLGMFTAAAPGAQDIDTGILGNDSRAGPTSTDSPSRPGPRRVEMQLLQNAGRPLPPQVMDRAVPVPRRPVSRDADRSRKVPGRTS
nr:hypothetical protein StreXyl84_61190 [Streptomyces sp. Xyl84]